MSLQIIYGKSGTGKSTYIFEKIAKQIEKKDNSRKIYIITPEQFSFTADKKLLDTIGNRCSYRCRGAYIWSYGIPCHSREKKSSGKSTIFMREIYANL